MEAQINVDGNTIKILLTIAFRIEQDATKDMALTVTHIEGGQIVAGRCGEVLDFSDGHVATQAPTLGSEPLDPMSDYVLVVPPSNDKASVKASPGLPAWPRSEKDVERSKLALLEALAGGKKKIGDIAGRVGLNTRTAYMRVHRLDGLIRGDGTSDKDHWYSLTAEGRDTLMALRKKYAGAENNNNDDSEEPSFTKPGEPEEQKYPISSGVAPAGNEEAEPFLTVPKIPAEFGEDDGAEQAIVLRGAFMQAQLLRRFETPRTAASVVAQAVKSFDVDEDRVARLLKAMENSGHIEPYGHGRLITTRDGAEKLKSITSKLARITSTGTEE
jgi:predicted transcriptional regulator